MLKLALWTVGLVAYFFAFFAIFSGQTYATAGQINGFGFTLATAVCVLAVAAAVAVVIFGQAHSPSIRDDAQPGKVSLTK